MMKRLKQVMKMNNITDSGIFTALSNYDMPWEYNNTELDIEYHFNHSGNKIISPLLETMISFNDDEMLSTTQVDDLAKLISNLYLYKWTKLYRTLNLEYNPIDNYNMKETSEDIKNSTNLAQTDETNTRTNNLNNRTTYENESENSNQDESKVSAFNSTEYQDNSLNTITGNKRDSSTTDETATGTITDVIDSTRDDTYNENLKHTLNRSGNIGVTTTQRMIEEERKVVMWDYFKQIFKDVDNVLTINYYGGI